MILLGIQAEKYRTNAQSPDSLAALISILAHTPLLSRQTNNHATFWYLASHMSHAQRKGENVQIFWGDCSSLLCKLERLCRQYFHLKTWINELLVYVPVIMHWPMKDRFFSEGYSLCSGAQNQNSMSVSYWTMVVPSLGTSPGGQLAVSRNILSPTISLFYLSSLIASSLKLPCPPPPSFLISFPPHFLVLALMLAVLKAGA